MLYELTDENFEAEILQSDAPCVIEFTASWCAMCEEMLPRMESVSEFFADEARFFIANVEENKGLRIKFAVASLPLVAYVSNGMKTVLFDELVPQDRLEERIRYMLDGGDAPSVKLRV